jgi:hypothetical protein
MAWVEREVETHADKLLSEGVTDRAAIRTELLIAAGIATDLAARHPDIVLLDPCTLYIPGRHYKLRFCLEEAMLVIIWIPYNPRPNEGGGGTEFELANPGLNEVLDRLIQDYRNQP